MNGEKEKKIEFTPEQEAAIKYRGGSLLVSAAAGSGKTKVLVERLLGRIDENDDIDEFLVITYTRAAAYELRERIYEELLKRLLASPGNKRLRRQVLLCRGASIDTIHTFCAEILRENAHLVRLPPDFRILDSSESEIIKNEVADDVITGNYENITENRNFNILVDTITEGRDDKQLREVLLNVYNKMQSLPYPGKWIRKQIKNQSFEGITDISETDCGAYMLKKIRSDVLYNFNEMTTLRDEMKNHPEFESKYAASVDNTIEQISLLLGAFDKGWDEAGKFKNIKPILPNRISGYDELKEIRTRCLKNLNKNTLELEISSEEHIKDMKALSLAMTALYELVSAFDLAYLEEKRKRGAADFSDLEHLTLSLLIDEDTGEKTVLAKNIAGRFKEIMIDEYQDVNAVQELLFSAISHNNTNLFMVGDIKQSIYRFRLADPAIFLSKYESFSGDGINPPGSDDKNGKKIHLSKNFRSKEGLLGTVNNIFNGIMSVGFGEMDYTEKEELKPGRNDSKGKQGKKGTPYIIPFDPPVEIDVLDLSELEAAEDEQNPAAIKPEADFIADKIVKMIDEGYMIPDEDDIKRAVTASDIVILLRSVKGRAWQYAKALTERGIQAEYSSPEDFFETIEIKSIISILEVIDNPGQDIYLAAVLAGPIYGLTPDELTAIRVNSPETDYCNAIKKAADNIIGSPETSLKCRKILEDIEQMRVVKADMSADRFIWHVYNKTGLPVIVNTMKNGKKRKNNLILFAESARKFEQNGYKGLFEFLVYIRNLRERGQELTEVAADDLSTGDDTGKVRIMSIHKSKGLEFPVVFLANTAKLLNFQDSRSNVVFHRDFGVGSMLTDRNRRVKYTTLTRSAIQSRINAETMSEELRVLYVAMTRAREKLVITAVFKDAGKVLAKITGIKPGKVQAQTMHSMPNMALWILTGAREYINHPGSEDNAKEPAKELDKNIMSITVHPVTPQKTDTDVQKTVKIRGETVSSDQKTQLKPEINRKADEFKYPFQSSVDLPSKMTVTGLSSLSDPEAESADWIRDIDRETSFYPSPAFDSKRKVLTPAERGILLHRVMQHIDYKRGSTEQEIAKELQRLEKRGIITAEEIMDIDNIKIKNFFNSAIGGRASTSNNLQNEFKFSILCPSRTYYPNSGDDEILLQGVVDCFFEEDGKLVVIDFKTDRVNEETIHEKARLYSPQLETYADALKRITGKPVKEQYIYFFALDSAYPVN